MLPIRFANMGSEQPINDEHIVPIVMRIVSVLSANRKRELKLLLGAVWLGLFKGGGCYAFNCWADPCWFKSIYRSILKIINLFEHNYSC